MSLYFLYSILFLTFTVVFIIGFFICFVLQRYYFSSTLLLVSSHLSFSRLSIVQTLCDLPSALTSSALHGFGITSRLVLRSALAKNYLFW